ncbi:MAG: glycoside hydrolase family 38 C-terminal domain-containing protein [Shimia sp.]
MNDVQPYACIALRADAPRHEVGVDETTDRVVLANELIHVEFDRTGTLVRVYDKEAGRDVLKPGHNGNRLQVFEDRPLSWDAWDIDSFFEDRGEIVTGLVRFEVIERGPLRAAVRIERSYRNSTIVQEVQLRADGKRIDFRTHVDWHETHLLLKVAFPVAVFAPQATYEIQWGAIERPTHRNTLWDYAKFEVCAHKWADLSEADYGVALLNDCKYGYDVKGDVLRLSLIKSATMPDPVADQGPHDFTYALLPHRGDWRGRVQAEAYELNLPFGPAAAPAPPLVTCDDPRAVIETVKPAEDGEGIVVRLFEAHRSRGRVRLSFDRRYARIEACDILERGLDVVAHDADAVEVDLTPFQIVSLRCVP